MPIPRTLSRGSRLSEADLPAWSRDLIDYIKSITPRDSASVKVKQTGRGILLEVQKPLLPVRDVYAVTVSKTGGAIGPASTWTYDCTTINEAKTWTGLTNKFPRHASLKYDFAPDGTYAFVFWDGTVQYCYVPELPQVFTCT